MKQERPRRLKEHDFGFRVNLSSHFDERNHQQVANKPAVAIKPAVIDPELFNQQLLEKINQAQLILEKLVDQELSTLEQLGAFVAVEANSNSHDTIDRNAETINEDTTDRNEDRSRHYAKWGSA